jgi:hypothetical protein
VLPCSLEDLQAYLDALNLPDTFDGIVSNFGALNCVPHLAPLAALVRGHLAPGGVVILGLMTRMCALEAVYFTATRRPGLAGRRLGCGPVNVPVAGIDVPTYYHRVQDVVGMLGPDVTLTVVEGIGVTIPPPYLESRWLALPQALRTVATTVDDWVARWPPFNRLGDHVLLLLTKEPANA